VKSGILIGSFTGDAKDIYGLRDIINEKATDLFKKISATPVTPPPQQEHQQVQSTNNKDYENRMKGAFGYALLNTVPGFGLGSYIQGDMSFGVKQSIMDAVGLVSVIITLNTNNIIPVIPDKTLPIVILGSSRVMGWIFPFVYQSKYNKSLDEALNSNNNISYSIDPLIIPRDGTPAVGLALNLRY